MRRRRKLTQYKAFRGDYLEPTPEGKLDTEDIPVYLVEDVDSLIDDYELALEAIQDRLV